MFHLAAFCGAKTDSVLFQNAPAVADNYMSITPNNRYLMPSDAKVFSAFAINDTITRCRITAPSLRNEGLPEVYPVVVSALPVDNLGTAYYGENGPVIRRNEEWGVEVSNGASTVDEIYAGVLFRERVQPVPPGKRMTIVGTSTITLVKYAWVLGTIAFDQTLPVGRYSVIGMSAIGTACPMVRLVFPRGTTMRPGVPCQPTFGFKVAGDHFRSGRQGEWGQFDQVAQPQLEAQGSTAGAQTITVIVDLVQMQTTMGASPIQP